MDEFKKISTVVKKIDDTAPHETFLILDATTGQSAIASGMSEEAARAVLSLSQSISAGEDNRARLLDQVSQLSSTMAKLNEGMADDQRIRDHLAQLNANVRQLSEDLRADRSKQTDIMASEIRGLSSSIAALISGTTHKDRKG